MMSWMVTAVLSATWQGWLHRAVGREYSKMQWRAEMPWQVFPANPQLYRLAQILAQLIVVIPGIFPKENLIHVHIYKNIAS